MLPVTSKQLAVKRLRHWSKVHEIAQSTSCALPLFVLAASSLPEVRDWAKFTYDGLPSVVPPLKPSLRRLRRFLVAKPDVHVPGEVFADVVADVQAFKFSKVGEFLEDILVEVLEVLDAVAVSVRLIRASIAERFRS